MVTAKLRAEHRAEATTQGHVALYARDARWRRAVAKSLEDGGHSHREATSPAEIHQLLVSQRYDVLALKIRDETEAGEIAEVLEGVPLPVHTILLGSASALSLTLRRRRGGTFRYVPGVLPAKELSRLVDVSISSGTWEECATENGASAPLEEVDLEEIIQSAASAVYSRARRKRQRFHSAIEGPDTHAYANPVKLRWTLIELLKLTVSLAPHGALVSVEAEAGSEDWLIRIRASVTNRTLRSLPQVTEAVREKTKTLAAAARALKSQGGMLWVDIAGPAALAFCLTLPLPSEATRSVPPSGAQASPRGGTHRKEVRYSS